jgi:hypothetical protein
MPRHRYIYQSETRSSLPSQGDSSFELLAKEDARCGDEVKIGCLHNKPSREHCGDKVRIGRFHNKFTNLSEPLETTCTSINLRKRTEVDASFILGWASLENGCYFCSAWHRKRRSGPYNTRLAVELGGGPARPC